MDPIDEALKKQIATLLRVIHVTRCSKEDNVPCQIEEGLFLGSIGAANNKDELKNLNITHILTVANSLAPAYPNDFVYKVINVADRVCTDLKQHFDECIDYIDEATRSGGGVLVHCFVGRSRSVTIIVAYLVKKHGMSVSQALEHVKSRRPQASPNAGFISQLESFERELILTTLKERFEGNASQKGKDDNAHIECSMQMLRQDMKRTRQRNVRGWPPALKNLASIYTLPKLDEISVV